MITKTKYRVAIIFLIITVIFLLWSIVPTLAPPSVRPSTKILAADGSLLYEVARPEGGLQTPAPLSRISQSFKDAAIAAEDGRFFEHHGIDWRALTRAFKDNLLAGKIVSGGSTIEEQLIKNLYFPDSHRAPLQKARELVAARVWAARHSKEETLETYLNTVFFGNNAYGISQAAQTYFRKDVAHLTLSESTLLAGIIAAPSAYEPIHHFAAARDRQEYVFQEMLQRGILTEVQHLEALNTPFQIFPVRHEIKAPHFVFRVLKLLEDRLSDIRRGYTIQTTLNPELQRIAEDAVTRRLTPLAEKNVGNAAAVAVNVHTGDVLAYIGGADYFNDRISGQVNMAAAKRQPGSSLKPFMYLTAFMNGFTPGTVIADVPVRFTTVNGEPYYPRNYNYRYFGPVTIRDALGSSLNIPAVKVLHQIGLNIFFDALKRFGLVFPQSPDYYGLGIVLGGGEVTLEDVTNTYAALARGAQKLPLNFIDRVIDDRGRTIIAKEQRKATSVFANEPHARQAAYLVTNILSDNTARSRSFGESNLLDIGKPVAVKTGTTKDFRDNWAFGYTPEFALGVWVGNADNSPMHGITGISGAVPIWHDVMRYHYAHTDPPAWTMPLGIVTKQICLPSGALATPLCAKSRAENYIPGTEPREPDTWYKEYTIDVASGRMAMPRCLERTVKKIFLDLPPEYSAWVRAADFALPPLYDCEGNLVAEAGVLQIIAPLDGDYFEIDPFVSRNVQRISFVASGRREKYVWHLNDERIETTEPTFLWGALPGKYVLSLEGASGRVEFSVK